jgi:multimeric flavodoxin WrbA/putative sterol carrier protein
MNATVIMGSPRGAKGASSRIAKHFASGLRRAGVEVDEIILKDYKINHCIGCYTCWTKTPGRCVHRDDMDTLLPKMRTDLVVWATPLYIFSVPGIMKDFLDRRLPLLQPFLVERGELTGHPTRESSHQTQYFLISVAGFPEHSHFDAVVATFKKFSQPYLGDILIGGAEPMSREQFQGGYAELYTLIEQAGYEVGNGGQMSQKTEQAIIEKTTYSPEQTEAFRKSANAYWESQITKEPKVREVKATTGKELKLSDGGVATFLAGMAMQYNPKAMPGFTGIIQFNFEQETYHLLIKDGQCKAYEGEHSEPDLTIITPKQVWLDVSSGKLDGTKAFMEGLYKTEGDMNLLMKFDLLFGAEETGNSALHDGENDVPSRNKDVLADDNIPEHRGPIKLPAMMWLTVAFLPWMLKWIGAAVMPEALARYLAAGVALLIAGYHTSTNVVTLFEAGTAIYLLISAGLTASEWMFFQTFGNTLDYLFLGGLWFSSLAKRFSLTAEYSRYLFPKVIWGQRSFRETNMIICAAWGGYFLVAAVLAMMTASGFGSLFIEIVRYLLLVPMFIFTDRFQKWYPERLMRSA